MLPFLSRRVSDGLLYLVFEVDDDIWTCCSAEALRDVQGVADPSGGNACLGLFELFHSSEFDQEYDSAYQFENIFFID